ncbi:hypothetical protein F4820DRAFT_299267 [Hypoxylon rubiginosum]|uniref:Uncharacterized protein n=1 Tax=Hypoxylon rubiginosum TaxID=110542 RepID=A0ACB9Z0R7_9PEZI|nr:hypothetical protein F4820DRAFT_299267 [Hypoxylon rubiginosum]
MSPTVVEDSQEALENEIADLELRLRKARDRLVAKSKGHSLSPSTTTPSIPQAPNSAQHYLLLLSDSALPLGSFAFSSGLESYLAHTRQRGRSNLTSTSSATASASAFSSFLPLSLSSYAGTTLPFVLAAHRDPTPEVVAALDDAQDAAVVCTVGRRASVAQGRALLGIWEKSMAAAADPGGSLAPYAEMLRRRAPAERSTTTAVGGGGGGGAEEVVGEGGGGPPLAHAHLAPLFGAVAALCGLGLRQAAYVFLLGHVKALVSAAVRAGLFGPYQAQRILAGAEVQNLLAEAVEREWDTPVEEAGQGVPVMDLWFGRHELLYSRIFNS